MLGFEPYKGRKPPPLGAKVRVHRNLNRRDGVWWSVTYGQDAGAGLVAGHAREITLLDATPVVRELAAARIAAGAPREVHAWVEGTVCVKPDQQTLWVLASVAYRPHERDEFFYDSGEQWPWQGASVVHFDQDGMHA